LADMVTRRLVDKIEYKPTYINAITSTNVEAARIPVTFDSDHDAVETAILTSVPSRLKLVAWFGSKIR